MYAHTAGMRYLLLLLLAQPAWAQRAVDDLYVDSGSSMSLGAVRWLVVAVFGVYGVCSLASEYRVFRYLVGPVTLGIAITALVWPVWGVLAAMMAVCGAFVLSMFSK